jgi:hypothetical protein
MTLENQLITKAKKGGKKRPWQRSAMSIATAVS